MRIISPDAGPIQSFKQVNESDDKLLLTLNEGK